MAFPTKRVDSLANSEWWTLVRRYSRFCVVGGRGMIVDMGVIYLLADPKMLNWNLTLSKAIAAKVALLNNFAWNELWTFRELASAHTERYQRLPRFLKFNLTCAAGIGLNMILLNVFAERPSVRPRVERVSGQFHRHRSGQRLEFPFDPSIWLESPRRLNTRKS